MLIATIAFAILMGIFVFTLATCDDDDFMTVLIVMVAMVITIIALWITGGK